MSTSQLRSAFRAALALDDSQVEVLATGDGVSRAIIGAPGSGKTTTLVETVAERVLGRGYLPSEVLALTPTRQSATVLRDRLALRLGLPTNGPLARTVNSLAFQIVQSARAATGALPPTLLTGAEQDRIIADLLAGQAEEGFGPEWPDPLTGDVRALRGFRTELRELMMRATESGVSPRQLAELGAQHGIPEWVAVGRFADEYQSVVGSFRDASLDSAELIAEARLQVVTADAGVQGGSLVNGGPHVLAGVRMIVVDDLQELSSGAVSFIATLARRGVTVLAFGDPDAATTSFRGGQKDALGRLGTVLGERVATAAPVYLQAVYRHGPGIRSLVDRSTSRIGASAAGRQRAARATASAQEVEAALEVSGVPAVRRIEAVSPAGELAAIVHLLREHHLLRGVPWNRMAVVVRSGALISSLVRGLGVAEVPATTQTGGRALRDDYAARHLARAVAAAIGVEPLSDELATELLLGPFGGLDAVGLRRLRLALRQEELAGGGNRGADALVTESLSGPGRLATLDAAPARRARRLADALAAVRQRNDAGASIEELLWELWSRSGLAPAWQKASAGPGILGDEANRNLDGIVGVFSSAKRFVERYPNRPAADFLVDLLQSEVPEDSLSPRSASDAVVVSTPNGVIGTEFDVVVVAGLQDSVWPNLRLRGSLLHPDRLAELVDGAPSSNVDERAEVLGDELRMFVLAVSRATTQVVLTSVANDDEQPSPFVRLMPEGPAGPAAAASGEPGAATVAVAPAPSTSPFQRSAVEHPLSLRALTGSLRRRLVETGDPAAAEALARLAAEGVPGADPLSWYGVLEPSTTEPLVDLDDPENRVDVSPSKLETFEKSPLAWFIDRVSGSTFGLSAGIGTLLHSVMEEVTAEPAADAGTDSLSADALWQRLDERWNELQFESPWLAERERQKTRGKVEGLSEYLRGFEREGGKLLGGEAAFALDVGRARLRGTVDRIEQRSDGQVTVVDLKTGGTAPSSAAVSAHAQLGSYQLALQAGALDQGEPTGEPAEPGITQPGTAESGGAMLLYVALTSGAGANRVLYKLLGQQPLDDEAIEVFRARIEQAATGMAGSTFPGRDDLPERDPHGAWEYRIHLVRAVSS
ncbi:ATP-dependent DNA helicase [Subtercola boreus]|uniref:DNA 3'-5' helicase n=1 Tax=Subtercola boreus TaxID=120213 RepID=A0A3E0VJX1_9MICO|nr:ATP-dependent DNA helicase [Subtercola boreus]RFA09700.1 ATP-dependent DNA helicase [Subtercola boreus]TQL53205.1 superfamily I DNA/RNA helicase [Subtercola boreus]